MRKIVLVFIFSLNTLCFSMGSEPQLSTKMITQVSNSNSWKIKAVNYLPTTLVATFASICIAVGVAIFRGIK